MKISLKSQLIAVVLILPSAFGSDLGDSIQKGSDTASQTTATTIVTIHNTSSNFRILNKDCLQLVTSLLYIDKLDGISLGFLKAKELGRLAITSRYLRDIIQPVLQKLKEFIVLRVTPILPRPTLTFDQCNLVRLLGYDPTLLVQDTIDAIGYYMAASRFAQLKMLSEAVALYEYSANHFTTTVDDIWKAGDAIAALGSAYDIKAANLYDLCAEQPSVPASIILYIGDALAALGVAYYEKAANLYESCVTRPSVSASIIWKATASLEYLGSTYIDRAAKLHARALEEETKQEESGSNRWDRYSYEIYRWDTRKLL